MTPEKRLNQIEPLIAEISAQLDRVSAQNRQLIATTIQNSDNTQFLLGEVSDLKLGQLKLEGGIVQLEQRLGNLEQNVEQGLANLEQHVDQGLTHLGSKVDGVTTQVGGLTDKVDLILTLLQSGNGRS